MEFYIFVLILNASLIVWLGLWYGALNHSLNVSKSHKQELLMSGLMVNYNVKTNLILFTR